MTETQPRATSSKVGAEAEEEPENGDDSGARSDDLTPEKAFDRTVEEGHRRLERDWVPMLATGVVGGIDVSAGILAMLVIDDATGSQLLAGLGFAIGFVALTLASSELFTENFLVPVSAVVARKARLSDLIRLWWVTVVGNMLGGWLLTLVIMTALPRLDGVAVKAGRHFATLPYDARSFCLALLAGLAMTLMTWMQHSTESVPAKVATAVIIGWLLVAAQLFHSILDSLLMFAALHTGHAGFGYGTWAEHFGWAAFGNMAAGLALVTMLRLLQVPHLVAEERRHPET